jgi:hypothetical protein
MGISTSGGLDRERRESVGFWPYAMDRASIRGNLVVLRDQFLRLSRNLTAQIRVEI